LTVLADKGGTPNENASDNAYGSAYGQDISKYANGEKPLPTDNLGQHRSGIAKAENTDGDDVHGLAEAVKGHKDSL